MLPYNFRLLSGFWERYCHFVTTELPFQQTLKQCISKCKWIQVMLALRFHWLDDKIWWETWYISDVCEHLWRKRLTFSCKLCSQKNSIRCSQKIWWSSCYMCLHVFLLGWSSEIKAKILLQSMWRLKIVWDDQLPTLYTEYCKKWLRVCSALTKFI